jgi:hypothetical protein
MLAVGVGGSSDDPKTVRLATRIVFDGDRQQRALVVQSDEARVPIGNRYVLLNGPTLLARTREMTFDRLVVEDLGLTLTPAEVTDLASRLTGPIEPPTEIRAGASSRSPRPPPDPAAPKR